MLSNYRLGILILAAGGSSRFEGIKQLARTHESFLLQECVDKVQALPCERIALMLGANNEHISSKIQTNKNTDIVKVPNWHLGLSQSIKVGVSHLTSMSHVLIVLGDQPGIGVTDLKVLIESSQAQPDKVICARYSNRNAVPAIFPKAFFPVLAELSGDKGAGKFLNDGQNIKDIKVLEMLSATLDIDTKNDLKTWLNKQELKESES